MPPSWPPDGSTASRQVRHRNCTAARMLSSSTSATPRIRPLPGELGEGDGADVQRDQPIGDAPRLVQAHHLPARASDAAWARRWARPPHGGRALRCRQSRDDARDQSAAADGTTTVSTSGSCSTISSATVAWPPRCRRDRMAGRSRAARAGDLLRLMRRSSDVRPAKTTSPPHFLTPATFTAGVVSGMTITARTPNCFAAYATAWP